MDNKLKGGKFWGNRRSVGWGGFLKLGKFGIYFFDWSNFLEDNYVF